jgi:hypothetical protein
MSEVLKTSGILLASALLLVLSGLGFLWCLASLEVTSIEYKDYADAQRGIEAGWLPEWFPESARRIQESHDIDTNRAFATFEFDPEEAFYVDCKHVVVGKPMFPRPDQLPWFPRFVKGGLKRVHDSPSLEFFRCDEGNSARAVAVDSTSGVAYIWMP